MAVYEIDPLKDARWNAFVSSHPKASVFHTPQWLEALRKTYQYNPVAFTASGPGAPLASGVVLCGVNSWMTGSKLISVPFSDHCEPLCDDQSDPVRLLSEVRHLIPQKLKYVEVRPRSCALEGTGWTPQSRYCFHAIDLTPSVEEIFTRLHKDGVQRKVRRAEREGVVIERGRSDLLLRQFYELMVFTRRRHGIPPQPLSWFRNLIECMGPLLTIYVAQVGNRPIASILTLRHNKSVVYKYGCSDDSVHNIGAMPRLFWQLMQDAKSDGLEELDLGRSDLDNAGLIRFKDHLGATKTVLQYWRHSTRPIAGPGMMTRALGSSMVHTCLGRLPDPLFRLAGELLYRHVG